MEDGVYNIRDGSDGVLSPKMDTVWTPKTNHIGRSGKSLDTLATCPSINVGYIIYLFYTTPLMPHGGCVWVCESNCKSPGSAW